MNAARELDILRMIAGQCDVKAGVDVVFVHGSETDAERCWYPRGHEELSFPRMLARDIPYVCAWSLGYTSTLYRRKGYTLRLKDQATQTLKELASRSIGYRPVIFVAHSVGGLLVKHVLRLADEIQNPEWQSIAGQTAGIAFLSTPHFGFPMVRLAKWLSYLPTLNDTILTDLVDRQGLEALNGAFLKLVAKNHIAVDAYYEAKPSPRLLWLARMVSEDSADPRVPGHKPTALAADHEGVCKPLAPDDHIFRSVRQFVRQCFAGPATDVFISYAHEDSGDVETLRDYLQPLLRNSQSRVWTDRAIRAGDAWETEILKHMESSRVAVLLISPAFLASPFIMHTELPFLWRKAGTERMDLICVPVSTVDPGQLSIKHSLPQGGDETLTLTDLQWASSPERPIESMRPTERGDFFARLAQDIQVRFESPGEPADRPAPS